jgi:hypothetical protein
VALARSINMAVILARNPGSLQEQLEGLAVLRQAGHRGQGLDVGRAPLAVRSAILRRSRGVELRHSVPSSSRQLAVEDEEQVVSVPPR